MSNDLVLIGVGVVVGVGLSRAMPMMRRNPAGLPRNPQFRRIRDRRTGRIITIPLRRPRGGRPAGYDYDWRQSSTDSRQAQARARRGKGISRFGGPSYMPGARMTSGQRFQSRQRADRERRRQEWLRQRRSAQYAPARLL